MLETGKHVIIDDGLYTVVGAAEAGSYIIKRIGGKEAIMQHLTANAKAANFSSTQHRVAVASQWCEQVLRSKD